MKKPSGFYGDSLEMLLDTMCNVLGLIIFITLTLGLMVGATPGSAPDRYQEQAQRLTEETMLIAQSNALAQAEIQQTVQRIQASRQNVPTHRMRLPTETPPTKLSWEVIVRNGELFPMYAFSGTARDGKAQNSRSVEWRRGRGREVYVEPRLGQGQAPESAILEMVQTFRAAGKTNYYFVFWVYDDSFSAFNRAKETAAGLGFQYGWNPITRDTRLKLGERGEKVPPQN